MDPSCSSQDWSPSLDSSLFRPEVEATHHHFFQHPFHLPKRLPLSLLAPCSPLPTSQERQPCRPPAHLPCVLQTRLSTVMPSAPTAAASSLLSLGLCQVSTWSHGCMCAHACGQSPSGLHPRIPTPSHRRWAHCWWLFIAGTNFKGRSSVLEGRASTQSGDILSGQARGLTDSYEHLWVTNCHLIHHDCFGDELFKGIIMKGTLHDYAWGNLRLEKGNLRQSEG